MSAARGGAVVAAALGLSLALAACGGAGPATGPSSGSAVTPPVTAAPLVAGSSSPSDRLASPSTLPQGIIRSSTFVVGDLVLCRVTDVKPLLVLLDASGRRGVIRGSAYEKVKVGDRVIVQITSTDGRFEAALVHVSTSS